MMKARKRIKSIFLLFFIVGVSISLLLSSAARAAIDPTLIKTPVSVLAVQPILAVQSIDLSQVSGINLSKVTPADTSSTRVSTLAVTVNTKVPVTGRQDNMSFSFKILPQLNTRNFTIESYLNKFDLVEVLENGQKYSKISLAGRDGFVRGEEGQAGLPGFTKTVAVPIDAKMRVEVFEGEPKIISDVKVCPVQPMPEDQSRTEGFEAQIPFIDKINYRQDRFLPDNLISIRYDVLRGCRVAVIQVTTARYNAALGELHLYPDLTLDISFEGGEDSYIPEDKRSVYFEDTYSSVLTNYSMVGSLTKTELLNMEHTIFSLFCDLLIITPQEFYDQAETLAAWKREKGFNTWVRTLTQIQAAQGGTTANDIRNYIKKIYTNNSLDYVLLLGDAEFLPLNYQTPAGVTCTPTDLYYVEMDGTGYFPDMAIGRMPVNSQTEAQRVVDRTIAYEENPPVNSSFYKKIILGAYFQDDNNDGRADRNYVKTIQQLYDYFSGKGYQVQREYVSSASNPQYYQDGTAIPADLKKPGFPWDGNASDIVAGLNSGAILLAHRDHGGRSGWSRPGFSTYDLSGLNTGSLSPVVFSINCQTGWFDNETDSDSSTSTESFAEQLLTRDGGALAVIAATRNSPTYPNDDLIKALTEHIWPDFYLTPTAAAKSKRLGDVLNAAKLYVENGYSGSTAKTEFELYHCLGDPTVELWTKNPNPTILIPWNRLYKEIQYVKLPEPGPDPLKPIAGQYIIPTQEDNVLVSLIRDGEIVGQAFSQDGQAVVDVDQSVGSLQNVQISYRSPSGYIKLIEGAQEPVEPGETGCLCEEGDDGIIDLGDAAGKTGGEVVIPVRIQGAVNDVWGIGFDVVYDADALSYVGQERGPLSRSFDMFNVLELEDGRIRIGGFDGSPDSYSIVQGSGGDVVFLKFKILAGQEDCIYTVGLESLVDDIRPWSASGGCVTVLPACDGDLTGDGQITPGDALFVFQCYMGSGPCSPCCDVNGEGGVTPADALCLFQEYMGLPSCLE